VVREWHCFLHSNHLCACAFVGRCWLCRATKVAERASKAFTSKGNSIRHRQWFAEVQFFVFVKEVEGYSQREHKLQRAKVYVPCSALVYETGIIFAREADGMFYLSQDMHEQIRSNDELQFDSDDEREQEERDEGDGGEPGV
jgi:hypothetical protein